MVSACIFVANGTEEMEYTITYDTLVRAGVQCTTVAVYSEDDLERRSGDAVTGNNFSGFIVECSRGVKIAVKDHIDLVTDHAAEGFLYDAIVIPGGAKGADTISKHKKVQKLIREHLGKDRYVGMICAGSLAALTSELHKTRDTIISLTSHPSVKEQLEKHFDYREEPVVECGKLITSRGPGTAFPFAFTMVERLCGLEKRKEITDPMVFPPSAYRYY